jgi:hypothetical protein
MTHIIPNNDQALSEVSSIILRRIIASTNMFVRPQVLTTVLLRVQVFWDAIRYVVG